MAWLPALSGAAGLLQTEGLTSSLRIPGLGNRLQVLEATASVKDMKGRSQWGLVGPGEAAS